MKNIKIYTKKGDAGTTMLANGEQVYKDSLQIAACGNTDELSSYIGLATQYIDLPEIRQKLQRIQCELQKLNLNFTLASSQETITIDHLQKLENEIDEMTKVLPKLKSFIIPGGNKSAAHLHVARTICRRAERTAVTLSKTMELSKTTLSYLNRLSDWLFCAARLVEKKNESK